MGQTVRFQETLRWLAMIDEDLDCSGMIMGEDLVWRDGCWEPNAAAATTRVSARRTTLPC
jgi:hypothetical protein